MPEHADVLAGSRSSNSNRGGFELICQQSPQLGSAMPAARRMAGVVTVLSIWPLLAQPQAVRIMPDGNLQSAVGVASPIQPVQPAVATIDATEPDDTPLAVEPATPANEPTVASPSPTAEQPIAIEPSRREKDVALLLAKARVALDRNRLTTPSDDNTVTWVRQALALDPGNERARALISGVIDRYLDWAKDQIDRGALGRARTNLVKARQLVEFADDQQLAVRLDLERELENAVVIARSSVRSKRAASQGEKSWALRLGNKLDRFGCRVDRTLGQRCGRRATKGGHQQR